ncbi:hypothetical protein [Streptomyces malaysiensis]|uniref:Uncharacterized protein n=1 Tax=Streptomyces malaysiensis TaxID=92644 RepID=A0A7X6B108_STRMQ|nr:hypothetical protein [Streptomyces malaysiensis]NIY68827.1 hypothetical protein [Streptomyces malaysiensis]
MTDTEFDNIAFLWGWWTFFEAVWIAVLWRSRTRVPGGGVYRLPGVRRIRRGACEKRVETLLDKLEQAGVPAEEGPDKGELVDRWHRIVAGRCVSVVLQAVPLLVVVLPFWWSISLHRTTVTPFWIFAAVAGFGTVSLTLMAADVRATAVSDAAGVVTAEAIGFLELLLIPARRRAQDSALDVHGRQFGRLCIALRAQARYGTRTMPPATRDRVRATSERLIVALDDANERYLLGEGADREVALRDLARLVAGALRQSCPPRAERDSLLIIDPRLLAGGSEADEAGAATEPLRTRLLAAVGRLAVAAGLIAGAFLVPGGEAVSALLVAAGVSSVAAIWPHLREALHRGGQLVGGSSTAREPESAAEEPSRPAPSPSTPCPRCSDRSTVTTESRTVG